MRKSHPVLSIVKSKIDSLNKCGWAYVQINGVLTRIVVAPVENPEKKRLREQIIALTEKLNSLDGKRKRVTRRQRRKTCVKCGKKFKYVKLHDRLKHGNGISNLPQLSARNTPVCTTT